MSDNRDEDAQMSARSRQRDQEGRSVSITEDTTVKTSVKTLWFAFAAAMAAMGWGVRLEMTVDGHTGALAALATEARKVSEKVDALLIDRGINPHEVVKKAEDAQPPAH